MFFRETGNENSRIKMVKILGNVSFLFGTQGTHANNFSQTLACYQTIIFNFSYLRRLFLLQIFRNFDIEYITSGSSVIYANKSVLAGLAPRWSKMCIYWSISKWQPTGGRSKGTKESVPSCVFNLTHMIENSLRNLKKQPLLVGRFCVVIQYTKMPSVFPLMIVRN